MRTQRFIVLLLVFFNCNYSPGTCQRSPTLQFYDVSSGLPTNHLYKIVQDKKGFIWISTENGISRFNGNSFKNYSVKEGLTDNDVLDLFTDSKGNVWFIPFAGTPFYYDLEKEILVNGMREPLLEKILSKQFLSGNAQSDGSICFYDLNTVFIYSSHTLVTKKIVFEYNENIAFYTIKDGREYIVSSKGILYEIKKSSLYFLQQLTSQSLVRAGNSEEGYRAFINTAEKNVGIINFSQFPFTFLSSTLNKIHSGSIFLKDKIAVAGKANYVYFLNKQSLKLEDSIYTGADNMYILQDKENELWVATADKGLIRISYPLIANIKLPNKIDGNIGGLFKTGDELYLSNITGSLGKLSDLQWKFYYNAVNNPDNLYLKKIIKFKENIYLGGAYNMYFVKPGNQQKNTYEKLAINSGIKDFQNYKDSFLYFGTSSNLQRITPGTDKTFLLDRTRSTCLTLDSAGRLYRGSSTGITIFKNDKALAKNLYDASEKTNLIKLMTTADGLVWGGSSNDSLYVWNDGKLIKKITFTENSYGSLCKGLASNKAGVLWYGTDKGLIKLNYTYTNDKFNYSSLFFGSNDGLGGAVINDFTISNDSLYLATNKGLKIMSCLAQPIVTNIPVYVSSIIINSVPVNFTENLLLDANSNYTQLLYTAIDYSGMNPRLQYKINSADWAELYGNTLTLNKMKPGNYAIKVRAINRNGAASTIYAITNLTVEAPFWQQGWFYALICLLSIGITRFILQYRNRKRNEIEKAQIVAIEKQREKIIADLHDDIGASLSSVQINSAVAASLFETHPQKSKILLKKLEKQSQSLAERMSDFIWSMKPGKNEFLSIKTRITNYASELLSAKEISFTVIVKNEADKLLKDFDIRKNVLLIAKEAINNAAKYSEATNVEIEIYSIFKDLFLEVCDNGTGSPDHFSTGNGIINMKRRTEELGGSLKILQIKPQGTKIKMCIPLP